MLRSVGNRVINWAARRGAQAALATAAEVAPQISREELRRVFEVASPITVYIHASSSRVTVRRRLGTQVQLDASLRASFGWQLVTEQDEAGVYIVAKRRPVVGALSSANFTVTVPPDARLLVHLSPGALILEDVDGMLDIPPIKPLKLAPQSVPTRISKR